LRTIVVMTTMVIRRYNPGALHELARERDGAADARAEDRVFAASTAAHVMRSRCGAPVTTTRQRTRK